MGLLASAFVPSGTDREALPRATQRQQVAPSGRGLALVAAWAGMLGACNGGPSSPSEDAVNRGRVVWMARCTSCHHMDPGKVGALGPSVRGASRELLEARVVRASYPPGYTPKRTTTLMQPLPDLAGSIDDLTAFLAPQDGAP